MRTGWDPNVVPLVKRMCRLVWSEFHNQIRETDTARGAEEVFLREEGIHADPVHAAAARNDPRDRKTEPVRHGTSAEAARAPRHERARRRRP